MLEKKDIAVELSEQRRMSEDVPRVGRQWIIASARGARNLPEPERRQAVRRLIREAYRSAPSEAARLAAMILTDYERPPTADEIVAEVYDKPADYWDGWLFEGNHDAGDLADLLATHAATSGTNQIEIRDRLLKGLVAAAGRPAREMVKHLIANPDTRRFVPASLQTFLETASLPASAASTTPGTAQDVPTGRTGGKGRPTSMDYIEEELRRRHAAGEMRETFLAESEELSAWVKDTHPLLPRPKAGSIRSSGLIAPLYRKLKSRKI
jgi:hypothetical protein